jgi:hypothetical protein
MVVLQSQAMKFSFVNRFIKITFEINSWVITVSDTLPVMALAKFINTAKQSSRKIRGL